MSQHRERFSSSGRFGDRHRKKEEAELLVFGYGCKIFHDDDRVQEQTDQLIAWMGDAEIMCDRWGADHLVTTIHSYC